MGSLDGAIVLVTGASAGIGEAAARLFARAGARVAVTARRADRLETLAHTPAARSILPVAGDIADPGFRRALVEEVTGRLGPIEVLVNNAGYGQRGPVELVGDDLARRQMDVNVFAPLDLARRVLPAMRTLGRGRIINVSSVVGRVAIPNFGWYSASKFALEALSDALRLEVAPFGIHVVLIEPGPVATEFNDVATSRLQETVQAPGPYGLVLARMMEARSRAGRGAVTATDCARVILEAAEAPHPRARYVVTGLARLLIALRWLLPSRLFDSIIRWKTGLPSFGALREGR